MDDRFDGPLVSLRRLEEGLRRLEAGLPPSPPHTVAMVIPTFSGNFSGPMLCDSPVVSWDMRREVSDLLAELGALAAGMRFQSQVQRDQADRIAALEGRGDRGGRQ